MCDALREPRIAERQEVDGVQRKVSKNRCFDTLAA